MILMMDFIYSVLEPLSVIGSTCLAYIQSKKKLKPHQRDRKRKEKRGAAILLWILKLLFGNHLITSGKTGSLQVTQVEDKTEISV